MYRPRIFFLVASIVARSTIRLKSDPISSLATPKIHITFTLVEYKAWEEV